jgi:hypothetical protein
MGYLRENGSQMEQTNRNANTWRFDLPYSYELNKQRKMIRIRENRMLLILISSVFHINLASQAPPHGLQVP